MNKVVLNQMELNGSAVFMLILKELDQFRYLLK